MGVALRSHQFDMDLGAVEANPPRISATISRLEEIGRQRPLTDSESRQLQRAIRSLGPVTKQKPWLKIDDRRLLAYLARGKKPRHIAPLMGRTERAIWRRMYLLGFRAKAFGKECGE